MLKILGICASPRKNGNSDKILNSFLDGAKSACPCLIKKLNLDSLEIKFYEDDDDMRLIYKEIDKADIIAIAAPVYFGSIPAKLKLMIDRFQPYWIKKEILKKPPLTEKRRAGLFFCVSGREREDFFKNSRQIIKNLFAVLGIEYNNEIYCGGVDLKGDIISRTGVLNKARALGKRIARNR